MTRATHVRQTHTSPGVNTAVCGVGCRLLLQKVDMLGTPEYMSPEVLQGMARKWSNQEVMGQSYDAAAADVWSVGAVIYGAATGQPLLSRFGSPARMADTDINENELSWDDLQYVMQCQTELLVSNAVVCTAQATYSFLGNS